MVRGAPKIKVGASLRAGPTRTAIGCATLLHICWRFRCSDWDTHLTPRIAAIRSIDQSLHESIDRYRKLGREPLHCAGECIQSIGK